MVEGLVVHGPTIYNTLKHQIKKRRGKMKKLIIMAMVLVFCLVGLAQAGKKPDSITASGVFLIALTNQGHIRCEQNTTDLFIYVEPLFWKGLTHAEKTLLVHAGMEASGAIKEGVIIQDMTSKSTLATGTIATRRIRIYK